MSATQLFEDPKNYFLKAGASLRGAIYVCLALGLGGVILGLTQGQNNRFWGAFILNLFFFFSLSLGGMAFGAMQDLVGALWGRPIRRIHEGYGAFMPVAILGFIIYFAAIAFDLGGAGSVYPWIKDPNIVKHFFGKAVWLQRDFMLIRNVFALALIGSLVYWQFKQSLHKDLLYIEGKKIEAEQAGHSARQATRHWSAPILVCYALAFSLLGFDLLMSLDPIWFSTLWGGWLFAIMMQTLMALTSLLMYAFKSQPLGKMYKRQQFHDIGKMMHGFTVFFAYLTYAHVLTYWYGNMPEETEYFLHRLHAPWIYLIYIIPLIGFVIPLYALIFKAAKWTQAVTVPLAVLILLAQWLSYVLVVAPAVADGATWGGPWLELLLFAGFLGLFMQCYVSFMGRFPMLSFADPLLKKSLEAHH